MNIWGMRSLVFVGRFVIAVIGGWFLGAFISLPMSNVDGAGQLAIILIPLSIVGLYILSFWIVPIGGMRAWHP